MTTDTKAWICLDIGPTVAAADYDPDCECQMYVYNEPSAAVWQAIAQNLHERGWSEAKIKGWLQSKEPRWGMDELSNMLMKAANEYANKHIP